jgi:CDP-paratose 2-epimerase
MEPARLTKDLGSRYSHHDVDIRDAGALDSVVKAVAHEIKVVIHTAAQPSHDWAVRDMRTDFTVNANGTLNLLN